MATLERAIIEEVRLVTNRRTLRKKDLLAWSTGSVVAEAGEVVVWLPSLGISAVVPVGD